MESTRLPPTRSGSRHSCGSNDGSTLTPSPPCRNDNFPHQQRTGRHSNRPGMGQQRSREPHHQMPHSRIHQRPCIRPPTHRNHLGSPTKNITPTATPSFSYSNPRNDPITNIEPNSKTNWDLLKQEIEQSLPPVINPHPTVQQLDEYAQQLISRITDAISKSTPRKRPSPHSKRWWTSDLSELRKHVNRARNRYRRTRSESDGDEWREYRTVYKREIRQAKNRKWKEFIEEADEKTIWLAKKYIDKPPSPYYIPTINGATSNEGKANEFKETFFPPPPPANIDDIPTATYPDSVPCVQMITINQIQTAINKTSPKKALGPDGIGNRVLKEASSILLPHLHALVQASLNTGHFPTPFRTTTTVVKANKTGLYKTQCIPSHSA